VGSVQPEHQLEITTKDGCSGTTWDAHLVAMSGLIGCNRSKKSAFSASLSRILSNFYSATLAKATTASITRGSKAK
jgi:hypothetical protein